MIKDTNKRVMITLPKEVDESMELIIESFRKKGIKTTKSQFIVDIFLQWVLFQNGEIEKAVKEEEPQKEKN